MSSPNVCTHVDRLASTLLLFLAAVFLARPTLAQDAGPEASHPSSREAYHVGQHRLAGEMVGMDGRVELDGLRRGGHEAGTGAVACGGGGNRTYRFSGKLQLAYDRDDDGTDEWTRPLEGVQLRIVRQGSPLKWAQGPDAVTDGSGEYDVDCTFARDRNGAVPGGKKIRFKVMARFRDSEFRIRKAGWTKNNWFEVGRVRGCNRSGGFGVSKCRQNDFPNVDATFEAPDNTAGRHAYMWWFYNDLQDRLEGEGLGLTNRPVFDRLLTISYPAAGLHGGSSHFLFNVHLEDGDWNATRTMIHEFMHRWDVGKLGGEGHISCLVDAHHKDPDRWNSSRCSGFMEGFAEAAAAGLEREWYGGTIDTYTHSELRSGNLNFVDPDDNYPVESRGEAERTDVGWANFIKLILVDDEMSVVSGSATCDPTDVGIIRMLEVLQQDAARKANWHDIRGQATFEWFTDILQGHVSGFTAEDARIYQKLGDPSMSADEVCGSAPVATRHTVVIRSDNVSGATDYRIEGGGELEKRGGNLEGYSVSRQLGDEVTGNRADGHVGTGNDGYIVDGRIPSIRLQNPGNAEIYVDGRRYHTIVINSEDVSGGTDYTLEGGGEIFQRGGELAGFQVTKQANDNVSGNRATGVVGSGIDGFIVLGDLPSISLSNPGNAEVYVDGQRR